MEEACRHTWEDTLREKLGLRKKNEMGGNSCKIHDHNIRMCNSKWPTEAPVFFENKSKTALTLDNSLFLKVSLQQ